MALNLFEKRIQDQWASLLEDPTFMFNMSIKEHGHTHICYACAIKYGQIQSKPKDNEKVTMSCHWCYAEKICAPVQYAGYPDENKFKDPAYNGS